jgi:unspecific monooxygenase
VVARALREHVDVGPAVLPAGAYVFVPIAAIHRDARCWPDPDAFRIDRWSSAPLRGTYLPFGGGPRRCIGEHFARLEAREIVAAVLRRGVVEPVGPLPTAQASVTLRPRGGLHLRVRPHPSS